MLSKLKLYALIALGVLTAFFGFMWQLTRANYKGAQLDGEKAARDVENKASTAIITGVSKENEIQNDNSTDRKSFLD